jgi:hypothetical protein
MRTYRTNRTGVVGAAVVAAVLGAGLVIVPTGAGADVVSGALGVRSVGSRYAGAQETLDGFTAGVTRAVKPGATGSYSLEAVNNGAVTSSYLISIPAETPNLVFRLLAGKTDVTAPATAGGFLTGPIDPGKSSPFTLEITAPTDATSDQTYVVETQLASSDGSQIFGVTEEGLLIVATKGSADNDIYINTAGQKPVRASGSSSTTISSETVKTGGKAKYRMKIVNDSAVEVSLTLRLGDFSALFGGCGEFSFAAKVGKTDITDQAISPDGYSIFGLLPRKSVIVNLTITNTAPWPTSCQLGNFVDIEAEVNDGTETSRAFMITNSV